jgi:hypothetical protein
MHWLRFSAMPSSEHAILVDLFRARPSLATMLLERLGVAMPRAATPEIAESTFPVSVSDLHADLVVVLRDDRSEPRLVVVIEVQLAVDGEKPLRWLTYQVAAQERHRCDVVVLVVAPDPRVARWARVPLSVGPFGRFAPIVLSPDEVPRPGLLLTADCTPELAILGALAHRQNIDELSLRVAARALVQLGDDDRRSLYFDLLLAIFGEALSGAVEELMIYGGPMSEWGKKHYREGRTEGLAKGRAEGKAEAVLAVLGARGFAPSSEERQTILACTDVERLGRWIEVALIVEDVKGLLATP